MQDRTALLLGIGCVWGSHLGQVQVVLKSSWVSRVRFPASEWDLPFSLLDLDFFFLRQTHCLNIPGRNSNNRSECGVRFFPPVILLFIFCVCIRPPIYRNQQLTFRKLHPRWLSKTSIPNHFPRFEIHFRSMWCGMRDCVRALCNAWGIIFFVVYVREISSGFRRLHTIPCKTRRQVEDQCTFHRSIVQDLRPM